MSKKKSKKKKPETVQATLDLGDSKPKKKAPAKKKRVAKKR